MRSKFLEKVSRKRQGIEKLELEFRSLSCLNATLLQVKKFPLFYLPPSLAPSLRSRGGIVIQLGNNNRPIKMAAIGSLVFCTDCGNLLPVSKGNVKNILNCECCGAENRGASHGHWALSEWQIGARLSVIIANGLLTYLLACRCLLQGRRNPEQTLRFPFPPTTETLDSQDRRATQDADRSCLQRNV